MQLLVVALAFRNRKTGGKPLTNYSLKILRKYTTSDSTILMWYHRGRLWSKAWEGGPVGTCDSGKNPYNEVYHNHHCPHLLCSGGPACPIALAIPASSLSLPVASEERASQIWWLPSRIPSPEIYIQYSDVIHPCLWSRASPQLAFHASTTFSWVPVFSIFPLKNWYNIKMYIT